MRISTLSTRRALASLSLTLFVGLAAHAARAESPPAAATKVEDHEKRIKELEQQLHDLNLGQAQVNAAIENQKAAKPTTGWIDGFVVGSSDGRFKLKIGAYTQADGRFFVNDAQNRNTNQFLFRRVRPDIQGTVFRYFDFRLVPDFAGSSFTLFDAYVDYTQVPWAKLRVGKFKPPVGLERLQSATALGFIERGQPTNLVPTRDNGVQLFGDLWSSALSYQLGIFNGVPDLGNSATDLNDDKDFAGRVFAQPFTPFDIIPLRGLGVGVAGSYGHERGTSTATSTNSELPAGYRSFGQASYFTYVGSTAANPAATPPTAFIPAAVAQGTHSRFSPQGYYHYGPFGFLGEYVSSQQQVVYKGQKANVDNTAWQVESSYVITGEPASFRGVSPFQPFDPAAGKWGALEATARYGELKIDDVAFDKGFASRTASASKAEEWVIGANWYLNKNIKLVLNYAQTDFKGGGGGTAAKPANRKTEQAVATRVQLAF